MPVRIKICGIQSVADLCAAVQAGADAVGLNFYKPSVRFIHPNNAKVIANQTPPGVTLVGVFANATNNDLLEVVKEVPEIRCFQFHGPLPDLNLIRSNHWIGTVSATQKTSIHELQREINALMQQPIKPSAILVDTKIDGLLGGTGVVGPWDIIQQCSFPVPLILAGGLTANNVQRAIKEVNPFMVDVASGVESSPGVKSSQKIASFAEQVFLANY